jgi:hypothetical protein
VPLGPVNRPAEEAEPVVSSVDQPRSGRWTAAIPRFLGVLFCIEIGAILLIFPWLTWWDQNFFSGFGERWYAIWMSPFFRGAVSGLGMLNLYVSFWDLLGLFRRR